VIPAARSLIRELFQVVESRRTCRRWNIYTFLVSSSACRLLLGPVRWRRDDERTRNGWRELGFPKDMWPAFLDSLSIYDVKVPRRRRRRRPTSVVKLLFLLSTPLSAICDIRVSRKKKNRNAPHDGLFFPPLAITSATWCAIQWIRIHHSGY